MLVVHVSPVCFGFSIPSFGFSFQGGLYVPPASMLQSCMFLMLSMIFRGEKKKGCSLSWSANGIERKKKNSNIYNYIPKRQKLYGSKL